MQNTMYNPRYAGRFAVSEARKGTEVEIKYEPGKLFPYRVVYAGTDTTVQTREYPEAMAYYTDTEARRGIQEEGLVLVQGKQKKVPLSDIIKSHGRIVDDYGIEWLPVEAPKTHRHNYFSVLTEYDGETAGFYEYKTAGWQQKLETLRKAREKTPFPKTPYGVSENVPQPGGAEPAVLGTSREGALYFTQVSYQSRVYSGWGATPERSVKNARDNAFSNNIQQGTDDIKVLGTRKENQLYFTQVSSGGKIYSGWGATPERSVKNARDNALSMAGTVSEQLLPQQARIENYLEGFTIDTSRYSAMKPIPESVLTGVASPAGRYLVSYHVTDDPVRVLGKLKSGMDLCEANPSGDLGCGFYVSGVPEFWYVRSTAKFDFAKKLTKDQREDMYTAIMRDTRYQKGGGYLSDFEIERLRRDLRNFVETGGIEFLASAYGQPYNVRVTPEIAKQAHIPAPGVPRLLRVVLTGKFISVDGLYGNPEIIRAAQAWAVVNRPRATMNISGRHNIINAWLSSLGYAGAFTKSGMTTNPEMVIWDRRALVDVTIEEPKR